MSFSCLTFGSNEDPFGSTIEFELRSTQRILIIRITNDRTSFKQIMITRKEIETLGNYLNKYLEEEN